MLLIALFLVVVNGLPISQLSMGKSPFDCDEGETIVDDHCCPAENIKETDKLGSDGKVDDGVCCQHGPFDGNECPEEEMDTEYGQLMAKGKACPDGLAIETESDCQTLAARMGLCDKSPTRRKDDSNSYPPGCSYKTSDSTPCSRNRGKKLYFNPNLESTYLTDSDTHSKRVLCNVSADTGSGGNSCGDKYQMLPKSGCCYETNILWNAKYDDGTCCKGAVASGSSVCPPPGFCGVWLDPAYKAPYYKERHCPKKQNAKLCNDDEACEWWFEDTSLNRKPDCDSYWLSETECLDEDSTAADQECYWGGEIERGCHSTACLKDKEHHHDVVHIEGEHFEQKNKYRYDITIGSKIMQFELSGDYNSYDLGTQSHVVGNKEYYTGGDLCMNFGRRNSTIEYFFGGSKAHGEMLSEKEVSTCVYQFQIQLPDCLICADGEIEIHEEGKEHECCPVSRQTTDENGQDSCCPPGEQPVDGECCGNDKILWTGKVATVCCAGDTVRTGEVCGTVATAPAAPAFPG